MSEDVHHLVLSEYEVTMIGAAARNLGLFEALAESLGGGGEKIHEQAKVLHAIERRLLCERPIELVTRAAEIHVT